MLWCILSGTCFWVSTAIAGTIFSARVKWSPTGTHAHLVTVHWSESYGKEILFMTWTPFVSSKQNLNLGEEFDIEEMIVKKTVLVKHRLLWRKERRQTLLEEELKLHKFHGILCPESERNYVLISDLYDVWTGIRSSKCESRAPSPQRF